MQKFRVKNWKRFQHYKDRAPPWIKFHNCTLDDYAFRALPDEAKAHLVCIWLLASRYQNDIPADPDFIREMIGAKSAVDLSMLEQAGFIELDHECSKSLAKRGQSAAPRALARVEAEAERETEAETDRGSYEPLSSSDDAPKNTTRENAEQMMEMWNELASRYPCLPTVRKLTGPRIKKAALRLSEIGGLEGWQEALEKIEISGHCLGNNDRGWVANFDFLLQPSSLTKLLEGNYDDRTVVSEKPENPYALAILEDRARREN